MKRPVLAVVAVCAAALTACGGGDVVVQAHLTGGDGQPTPLRDLAIQALPYDRDAVFDSLAAAYPEPEPEIPADLLALQDSIAAANREWSTAQAQWGASRDSLQDLYDRLAAMANKMSAEYIAGFSAFGVLEARVTALETRQNRAFERFTSLQDRYESQRDQLKLVRDQWGDRAFAAVDTVLYARQLELGLEPADTVTDANGVAYFKLKPGQYWIHARYELPYEELYWNLPVQVARGEPAQVQLTRETAQTRPKL